MDEVKSLQITVIKLVGLIDLIAIIALGAALQLKAMPYILGLVLGSAIALLMLMLLTNTVVKSTFMDPAKAQVYMGVQYMIRMSIMAIVLYISVVMPYLNVYTTAVGIFLVKGILYAIQLRDQKQQIGKQKITQRKEE